MRILAIDTAMAACSAAIVDTERDRTLASRFLSVERGHAEILAPMVHDIMGQAALGFSEIDRIAVTIGPGTFTGVRIGLSFARGLGLALKRPVTGIDTLSAIAANAGSRSRPLLVAADARRDEVYAAVLGPDREILLEPSVLKVAGAAQSAPPDALVIGSGADRVIAAGGKYERCSESDLPHAANFASWAATMPATGDMPAPLYLRPPDARPKATTRRIGKLEFRRAGGETAPLLAALHGECFDTPWTPAAMGELLATPGTIAVLAMAAGNPVSFALFRRAADEAEIITIGTTPRARREGAASSLLVHQFEAFRKENIAAVFIEVAKGNAPALALYEKLGFDRVGARKDYYDLGSGRAEDAIVMRKALGP